MPRDAFQEEEQSFPFAVELQCRDFDKDLPENNQTSVECLKTLQAFQREKIEDLVKL